GPEKPTTLSSSISLIITGPDGVGVLRDRASRSVAAHLPFVVWRGLARLLDRLRQLADGRRHRTARGLRQRAHLLHQLLEVGRCEGLGAVGEGLVRVRVNLDDKAVDAGGDWGPAAGR